MNFAAGVESQEGISPSGISDDLLTEGDETVTLILTNAVGTGATVTIANAPPTGGTVLSTIVFGSSTLRLIDDENSPGTLQFAVAGTTVTEGAGSVSLDVIRSAGSLGTITVDYSLQDGTALVGQDYNQNTQLTLSYADGEISKTIVVDVVDDGQPEGDETFTLTLTNPQNGAAIGTISNSVVTVIDDDSRVEFASGSLQIHEAAGNLVATVRRSAAPTSPRLSTTEPKPVDCCPSEETRPPGRTTPRSTAPFRP